MHYLVFVPQLFNDNSQVFHGVENAPVAECRIQRQLIPQRITRLGMS